MEWLRMNMGSLLQKAFKLTGINRMWRAADAQRVGGHRRLSGAHVDHVCHCTPPYEKGSLATGMVSAPKPPQFFDLPAFGRRQAGRLKSDVLPAGDGNVSAADERHATRRLRNL
jgi:hypothetical protein